MAENNHKKEETPQPVIAEKADDLPIKDDSPGSADSSSPPGEQRSTSEWLAELFQQKISLQEEATPEQLLSELSLDGIVKYILDGKCQKIVTMAGAGISTTAGIPDFRSPGTGLYDNLQKYDLPNPQAIFEIGFFKENPEPFYALAKELYPGTFKPTPCHYFLRLLEEKGFLLRHFTQNIDTLERVAGLEGDKMVEAHGTFHTAHCIMCREQFTQQWVKEKIFADEIPKCTVCDGLVKPDIVFFGESMPDNFIEKVQTDLPICDLLIILGTSLAVHPFASLTSRVDKTVPRLYINLEKTSGGGDPMMELLGMGHGFRFDREDNYRDVFWQGSCDDGCLEMADKLGWGAELRKLVETEHAAIEATTSTTTCKPKEAHL